MVIILFVALFFIALIITLIGSHLSSRSRTRPKRNIAYAPRPARDPNQGNRIRDVRRQPIADQPYRQAQRPYAPVDYIEVEQAQGNGHARRPAPIGTNLRAQAERVTTDNRKGRDNAGRGHPRPYESPTPQYLDRRERPLRSPVANRRGEMTGVEDLGFPVVKRRREATGVTDQGFPIAKRRREVTGITDQGFPVVERQTEDTGVIDLRSPVISRRREVKDVTDLGLPVTKRRREVTDLELSVATRSTEVTGIVRLGPSVINRQTGVTGAVGLRSPVIKRRTEDRGLVGLWNDRVPHWLQLTLLTGTPFCLCLLLFMQMANFGFPPALAIMSNLAPQPTPVSANSTVYGENLNLSGASKSLVRLAQGDPNQYISQDEYNQWAASACSAAAMTEIINAYGHNYRITDILKVEAGLHEITPELGLLEDKGISRTMDQFGFKMVPLQHTTLDDAIDVANQGHPVIISFASSGYWPGGHILVLRGGNAQNVDLADSSRLNLTIVTRNQFSQWWRGFTALAVPQ